MRISKQDALALAKVLHQHVDHCYASDSDKSEHQETLEDLAERVDSYLVHGVEDDCCDDEREEEEEEDEEAEDDDEDEEDSSEEGDEEDDEDEGEGDESSDSDDEDDDEDEEEDLSADAECASGDLHDLPAVKAKQGAVEFEAVEEGDCDLLLDGGTEHSVTHLRRKAKELHVRDADGKWHVYNVSRFSKGWSALLPLDELVELID
jgi:hypothetical protein